MRCSIYSRLYRFSACCVACVRWRSGNAASTYLNVLAMAHNRLCTHRFAQSVWFKRLRRELNPIRQGVDNCSAPSLQATRPRSIMRYYWLYFNEKLVLIDRIVTVSSTAADAQLGWLWLSRASTRSPPKLPFFHALEVCCGQGRCAGQGWQDSDER